MVSFVQRQQATRLVVSAPVQIAGEKRLLVPGVPARVEIRKQKGQFVGYIDPTERRLELQAIESDQLRVQPHDVGSVQIAVAFAYTAILASSEHPGSEGLQP